MNDNLVRRIHKYAIPPSGEFVLNLPLNAKILCVQTQNGKPFLWAMVFHLFEVEPRVFVVVGTGHPVPLAAVHGTYVGTFQLDGGALVFHLFEGGWK